LGEVYRYDDAYWVAWLPTGSTREELVDLFTEQLDALDRATSPGIGIAN
jgi:hypothetical protein